MMRFALITIDILFNHLAMILYAFFSIFWDRPYSLSHIYSAWVSMTQLPGNEMFSLSY